MRSRTHTLTFDGNILLEGFWLYIWEITTSGPDTFHYVGRTGDAPSKKAKSVFNRSSQNLGNNSANNTLRKYLLAQRLNPTECKFRLVTHGPLFPHTAVKNDFDHRVRVVSGLEKALADTMRDVGYVVLNTVTSTADLDAVLFRKVLAEFGSHFPKLLAKGESA